MQIGIVWAALRQHRLAAGLIVMQIALVCGVICNAAFLLMQRAESLHRDSGVAEDALGVVTLSGFEPAQAVDLNARVLAALRGVAGVEVAGVINTVPFGVPAGRAGVDLDAEHKRFGGVVEFYIGDAQALSALGPRLVAGRLPTAQEYTPVAVYVPPQAPVLLTRTLATRFWPGQNPLGQRLWSMDATFTVVGVLDRLVVTEPDGGVVDVADGSIFVPALAGPQLAGTYVIRGQPGAMDSIMRDALAAVRRAAPEAVLDDEQSLRLTELRERYFKRFRIMVGLLAGVITALLGTTALGIVGLTGFWVTQRRKQIGIRRALGATRGDILRYFQVENFLIVSAGIALGMLLAYGLSLVLMRFYELPPLPLAYLPMGAAALWLLGQLAVLAPALRATRLPPVAVMRMA
ncbi:MAG: ABC transporter permease [Proteobacteria bacterium]|nr:ABC transporter permease [Pseudomonadota bacterium]